MNLGCRVAVSRAIPLVASLAAFATGCASQIIRETVHEDRQLRIVLRQEQKHGEAVDKGYAHPASIAPVRLVHILSCIDLRTEAKKRIERVPAIPTDGLYEIADHLSEALAKADSTQDVAVWYIRRAKRFGIFDRYYLTSFVGYMKDDLLHIHMSRADWELQKTGKDERLPEPKVGEHPMKFRVIPSRAMTLVDAQSVAVSWRDPFFKKATRTRLTPSGKVVRRTILMEQPEPEDESAGAPAAEPLPADLSPAILRELADLEELRRRGAITETEYAVRRRQIIDSDPHAASRKDSP